MRRGIVIVGLLAGCPGDDGGSTGEEGTTTTSSGTSTAPTVNPSTTTVDPATSTTDPSMTTTEAPSTSSSTSGSESSSTTGFEGCVSEDIQERLDAVSPGAVVTICEGTYMLEAPLAVPAGVTLAGESTKGVVLRQLENDEDREAGVVITVIGADGARVTTMTLRGPDDSDQYGAIWVENSDDVTVDEVEIYDFARDLFGYGVVAVGQVDSLLVEDSYFEHNRQGVSCDAEGGITNNTYQNNTFVNHTDAAIENNPNSSGTSVLDNIVTQGDATGVDADGILMQGLDDFLIDGNTVDMGPQENGRHGIVVRFVPSVATQTAITGTISNNTITNLGNTTTPNQVLGVAVLGEEKEVQSHNVVLDTNTATGAGMTFAFYWNSPAGLVTDPVSVPDTTLVYP